MFKKRFTISLFQKYQNYLQRKRSLKIRQYTSDDLLIVWRTIYSFPKMNTVFTLHLVSFSIKFWTEFYPSVISLSKTGMCELTPLCTFYHSMEENMHPFFSVSLLYKISGIQFNCFLEVIYFPKSMYSSVSVSHLIIRFFYDHLILLSKQYIYIDSWVQTFHLSQYIYSCNLKNTNTTGVVFLAKVKAVF